MPVFQPSSRFEWAGALGSVFDFITILKAHPGPMSWDMVEMLLGPAQLAVQSNVHDQVGYWI